MSNNKKAPDIRTQNHGSVWLFWPISVFAKEWVAEIAYAYGTTLSCGTPICL